MTFITRFFVACFVLIAATACATKPPAAHVEWVKDRFTAQELANVRMVYFEEHDLVLTVPKRWFPRNRKQQRESPNEVRLTFQDRSNRNAHGIIWILNAPRHYTTIEGWARSTMRNRTKAFTHTASVVQQQSYTVDVGGGYFRGWTRTVSSLGNLRDMAILYSERLVPEGTNKWLIVAIQNHGTYRSFDLEKDIKDIAIPLFVSFLHGPIGSEPIRE